MSGEHLVDLSTEDLFLRLGVETTSPGLPLDPDQLRKIGESVFKGWLAKVKNRLCAADLHLTANPDRDTAIRDAAAVTDVVMSLGHQIPTATVSYLVIRYGLRNICAEPR